MRKSLLLIFASLLVASAFGSEKDSSYYNVDSCTISKRFGGLVVEKESDGRVVDKFFASSSEAAQRLLERVNTGHCLKPVPAVCSISKRNAGFAVIKSETDTLVSFLGNIEESARDLEILMESDICSEDSVSPESTILGRCGISKRNAGFVVQRESDGMIIIKFFRSKIDAKARLRKLRLLNICD